MTPLMLIDNQQLPGRRHLPVWTDPLMTSMICELCGMPIRPDMTIRELFSPCSGGTERPALLPRL